MTGREEKEEREGGGDRGGVEDVRGDRQRLGVPPTIESMREPRKSRSEAPEMGGIGDTLPWNRGNPHSHTGPPHALPRCIQTATAELKLPSPEASLQALRSLHTGKKDEAKRSKKGKRFRTHRTQGQYTYIICSANDV